MEGKKWYGLTIPKRATKVNTKGISVFDSDDSDDSKEKSDKKVKKEISTLPKEKKRPPALKSEVDSHIYEYDSIYDEMKASQKQGSAHSKSKEARYINLLLKAADKRKKEGERRVERKIQAERIKEGNAFKDKEAFVTSAYRQKMIEMEDEEERERRESILEDMMDSTRQKDLSGFYQHFLKQTVGEEKVPEFGERDANITSVTKEQDCTGQNESDERSQSPMAALSRRKYSLRTEKDAHNVMKCENTKLQVSDCGISENKHGVPDELQKLEHQKDKTLHRNRHHSPSNSERKSGKHSDEEKPCREKPVHSAHSFELLHNGKLQNAHNSMDRGERQDDRGICGLSHGSVDAHAPRMKPCKSVRECKKGVQTHCKAQKGLTRTYNISIDEKHGSSSNKTKATIVENVSSSPHKRRKSSESSSDYSDEHSGGKHLKYSINKDDTSSNNSLVDQDSSCAKNIQHLETKAVPENQKTGMMTKFIKRTVAKVFDDAQARYFKRRDAGKIMG